MSTDKEMLGELTTSMKQYMFKVKELMDSKVGRIPHVDNAQLINNMSYEAFYTECMSKLREHIKQKGNVHHETAHDYNMLTNEEFKKEANARIAPSYLPISRWGNLTFLPPGISGSFEGSVLIQEDGSGKFSEEFYTLNLEDDGTLIFIRNATNGRTRGAYYGYVNNAISGLSRPILTNYKYNLPGVPNNVDRIWRGGQGAVVGKLEGSYNGGTCFISLTNGTLDPIQHRYVVLGSEYEKILEWCEVVVDGNTMYFIEDQQSGHSWDGNYPIKFSYYKYTFTNQENGKKVSLERLPINEQRGLANKDISGGNKQEYHISTGMVKTNSNDRSCLITAPTSDDKGFETGPSGHGLRRSYSGIKNGIIKTMFEMHIRSWSIKYSQDWWTIYFIFYYDTNTGKAYLESSDWKGLVIDMDDTGRPIFVGNIPVKKESQMPAFGYDSSWNNPASGFCWNGDEIYTSYSGWGYDTRIEKQRFSSSKSFYDHLQIDFEYGFDHSGTGRIWPEIGSPIGPWCNGFTPLGNGWALTRARDHSGNNRNVLYRYDASNTNNPTRKYVDVEGVNRIGFELNTDRYYQDDVPNAISPNETMGLISIWDGKNVKVRGSYFSKSGWERQATDVSDHLVGSNYRTVSKSRLNDRAEALKLKYGYVEDDLVYWDFIIPGLDDSTGYLFIIAQKNDHSKGGIYCARIYITVNSSTYDIGDIRDHCIITQDSPGYFCWIGQAGQNDPACSIAGKFYLYRSESDNGWLWSWLPTFYTERGLGTKIALHNGAMFGFLFNDGAIVGSPHGYEEYGWVDRADPRASMLPGKGIGIAVCDAIWTTNIFYTYARTKDEVMNTFGRKDTGTVLGTMEVASGWMLYITETIPCVMAGRYYQLPTISIDLKTIDSDPANKTFYLYVELVDEKIGPKYVIRSKESLALNESRSEPYPLNEHSLFVAAVTTNSHQIVSIVADKVTCIGGYTLSTKPRGQAVPVSSGNPDTVNTLAWV